MKLLEAILVGFKVLLVDLIEFLLVHLNLCIFLQVIQLYFHVDQELLRITLFALLIE